MLRESPDVALAAGDRVGSYEIVEALGAGGMGEVYKARDQKLDRLVALKLLRPEAGGDPNAAARLLAEARAASALNHPGIATVYEVGDDYISMEYVDGSTLAEHCRRREPAVPELLGIASAIAEALAAAHERGIVHRDVKPSNVLVAGGDRVKLVDFGLARLADPFSPDAPTESAKVLEGTVSYMSPEQLRGAALDARTDVFSLGVVLYEMLEGRPPFTGRTVVEIFDGILRSEPPPLTRFGDELPPELARIVLKMLEKDRDRRFQTMRDVYLDLEAARRGLAGSSPARRAKPAIAVMSFANVTGRPEDEWLGTGIAETVTADLENLKGVTVIGRERIFEVLRHLRSERGTASEEKAAVETARRVGARWLIGGAYQRFGETLRITARFVEVESGEVLRTVKIDGRPEEIFELQDEIATKLTRDLCLTLDEPEPAPELESDDTHSLEAYEAYSKGLVNIRADSRDSLDRAIALFEKAVALDPGYARAHLALGSAYQDKGDFLGVGELVKKALVTCGRAVELRPKSAQAWRGLGSTYLSLGRVDEALGAVEKAASLAPDDAEIRGTMARVLFVGKGLFREAAEEHEKALAANPQAGWSALQLAHCRALTGELERGREAAKRAIELQEQFLSGKAGFLIIGAHTRMGHLLDLEGRHAEAIAEYEREIDFLARTDHALKDRALIELHARMGEALARAGESERAAASYALAIEGFEERLKIGADDPYTRYYAATALAGRGDFGRAIESLEVAAKGRPAFTIERVKIDPAFDVLRDDGRFRKLVGR
jgi:TolB-like protein/tRNA A-37 threonylcarbamoyl transferase component Bud32/Tfp pilus assembly protein PilF